jgi:hypothetical protein
MLTCVYLIGGSTIQITIIRVVVTKGIDGSPPPLLATPVFGGGGDLGPALGIVEGSLIKLNLVYRHRCYGGYGGVVWDRNKVFPPPCPPRWR